MGAMMSYREDSVWESVKSSPRKLTDVNLSNYYHHYTQEQTFKIILFRGGFTLEKNDGDVPARTKFYDPILE